MSGSADTERMPALALLAGGLATRLRPITATIPKSIVMVAGKPFIAHQLSLLARQDITDVVVCTGYLGEQIESKMQAVGCYESQFVTGRLLEFPTPLDDIRDRARYWGWSIGARYGEPFVSREDIAIKSLQDLM